MGMFDNLNGALPQENSNRKLEDGDYRLKIKKCLAKESQQFGNDVYIVEFEVLESSHSAFKAGDSVSWTQNLDTKGAGPSLSNFICSAFKLSFPRDKDKIEKEIAPRLETLALASVDKGILSEKEVRVTVKTKKTKKGFDFKAHYFAPVN